MLSRIVKIFQKVAAIGAIVRQNLNRTSTVIRITNPSAIYTLALSNFWSLIVALLLSVIVGLILGLAISGFIGATEYLFYYFKFRTIDKSATWDDYLRYRANPKNYYVQTRGGSIAITDILEAIDASHNAINPVLAFLKRHCFDKPGFYKINLTRWAKVVKSLNKIGLVRWFLFKGQWVGLISIDSFLVEALKLSSLTFKVPAIGNVELGIYEFSNTKLLFNLFGLITVISFGVLSSALMVIEFVLTQIGLRTLAAIAGQYAASSGVGLLAAVSVYYIGQFSPPNCQNFADYMVEGSVRDGKIQIPISEFANKEPKVFMYVPPSPEIEVLPVDMSSTETLKEIPTLGSILKERHFGNYLPRRQLKKLEEVQDLLEVDVTPSDAPIFQRLKEKVVEVFHENEN